MIKDILFPPRCAICEKVVKHTGMVCELCKKRLPYIKGPRCKKCGKPVLDEREEYCPDCEKKSFSYKEGRAVFLYEKEIKASLSRFKFQDKQEYAAFYGGEIARLYGSFIEKQKSQALLPVPVHIRKRRLRGYNQAELIAKEAGRLSDIPVITGGILRVRETRPQKELNDRQRKENLRDAFCVNPDTLKGIKRVVLIDDIYTTGSTIEACSEVLIGAGLKEICFLCVSIGANI